MRPRVFIGSSTEGLDVARAIQANLDDVAEVELWTQGAFGLTTSTLASLLEAIERTDFAVLVLQADDLISTRGEEAAVARDNVIFELGLFLGALGTERTAFVIDRDRPPALPSDLAGITPATYQRHTTGNLSAALGKASTALRAQIELAGPKPVSADPASGVEADRTYLEFHTRWAYSESPVPGYWRGVQQGRRVIRAEKPIPRWTFNIVRRADDDTPFTLAKPTFRLVAVARTGNGQVVLKEPRHQTNRFTVDVEFQPPLAVGEECTLGYEVDIPAHKVSTHEAAIARPLPKVPSPGGGEFSSAEVAYRIEDFVLEVCIPRHLGARSFGLQVVAFGDVDHAEQTAVATAGAFTQEIIEVDGEERVRLVVRRSRPPRKRTYRIHWIPPLAGQVAARR